MQMQSGGGLVVQFQPENVVSWGRSTGQMFGWQSLFSFGKQPACLCGASTGTLPTFANMCSFSE